MKIIKKQAFTMVELIVVILILLILGIIAFISLQGYSANARDSKRIGDIQNIKKSLELFSLNTGKYPEPDNKTIISYSGEIVRNQGTIGEQVSTNLSKNLQKKPIDPLSGEEYTYSATNSQTEYEVLGLYESDLIGIDKFKSPFVANAKKGIISSTNAATLDYPKIEGNYNGLFVRTSNFYVPTPSIINANLWGELNIDLKTDTSLIESQVVTGGDNIPGISTGNLDITLFVYEGTIKEESTDEDKIALVQTIQTSYSGSKLANDYLYADLLSKTSSGTMIEFVDVEVLKIAEYSASEGTSVDSGIEGENDAIPNQFTFLDQELVNINTQITSSSIIVGGMSTGAIISVTGGEYNINDGEYQSGTGLIHNGDEFTVKVTSSSTYESTKSVVLDIGGINDSFDVTTMSVETVLIEFPETVETVTCSGCD